MSRPSNDDLSRFPFLFGAQYYRAPTPEPACWEADLARLRELGFNAVKYWVQWRWSHRSPDRFRFDDVDRLMDLAAANGLGVTLNVVFDVAPGWLFHRHPDARQITSSGKVLEPYAVGHRQIGGHPGPCYNHPGALADRQRFFAASIDHFRAHPALQMWDVWNEPELCFPSREPALDTLVCYCPHCRREFVAWLRAKYGCVHGLNAVWGRCYEDWDEVELPRSGATVTDFVHWREFHLDTLTAEARWRLEMVERRDPAHGRYLHVVPSTWFNAVTCADDFAMAEHCEVFAATMNGTRPNSCAHVVSAAQGRVCYNVESHVNYGSADMHQQEVGLDRLLADFLPQVGMGIKGFLFWQYRAEVLGLESPAWGLVDLDGSDRAVTRAAQAFWSGLQPVLEPLRRSVACPPQVALWRSRGNEIFHFCARGEVRSFNQGIEAWIDALYACSWPFRLVNTVALAGGRLDGMRLLVMPMPYYVTQEEADALDAWVRAGGVLLCEAHLAGYDASRGRHSRTLPGGGLSESWGLRETLSTSPRHLGGVPADAAQTVVAPDVAKAIEELGGAGGDFFPLRLGDGSLALGARRYAEIEAAGGVAEGVAEGGRDGRPPCLVSVTVGKGRVFYAGTDLGEAAARDPAALHHLLDRAAAAAQLDPTCEVLSSDDVAHVDELHLNGRAAFLVALNRGSAARVRLRAGGRWRGLYSGAVLEPADDGSIDLPARFADLLVPLT